MVTITKFLALLAIIYLVHTLVYSTLKPMNSKKKKRSRDFLHKIRKQDRIEKLIYFKDIVLRKISGQLLISDIKKNEYSIMIKRLDLKITPEELRLQQILYAMGAALAAFAVFKIVPLLGYVCTILIVLGWMYPIDELEKKIEVKNKNIMMDFPSFYSMVYYQYSRSINIHLSDVVKDFLPNANADMVDELNVFLDNIEYGEEYALKQLKKRVPLRYIIKFCDIMETRLRGYDNTSQMTYLKNEIYDLRVAALEDELKQRQAKNSRTQIVLMAVLVIYVMIYYYFEFIGAMKMFS